jgi:hypothetical protein
MSQGKEAFKQDLRQKKLIEEDNASEEVIERAESRVADPHSFHPDPDPAF